MAVYTGEGTTFSWGGTAQANVRSISFTAARGTIDVSNLSTTGGKDFLPTKLYEADMSIEVFLDPDLAGDAVPETYYTGTSPQSGSTASCVLTFPDSTPCTYTFSAICTGCDISAEVDGALTATYNIKIDGDITVG